MSQLVGGVRGERWELELELELELDSLLLELLTQLHSTPLNSTLHQHNQGIKAFGFDSGTVPVVCFVFQTRFTNTDLQMLTLGRSGDALSWRGCHLVVLTCVREEREGSRYVQSKQQLFGTVLKWTNAVAPPNQKDPCSYPAPSIINMMAHSRVSFQDDWHKPQWDAETSLSCKEKRERKRDKTTESCDRIVCQRPPTAVHHHVYATDAGLCQPSVPCATVGERRDKKRAEQSTTGEGRTISVDGQDCTGTELVPTRAGVSAWRWRRIQ